MIGCVIVGTLAAMGISRFIHRRCWGGGCGRGRGFGRHGFGHGGFGHGGFGGHGFGHGEVGHGGEPENLGRGWGYREEDDGEGDDDFRGPWFGRWGRRRRGDVLARTIVEYVRATPAQERAIVAAFDEFREDMKKVANGEGRRTRREVAEAFRKNAFDGVLYGELFARHDTSLEAARKAFVGLTARLHDTLDEEQRGRLAHVIERGPRLFV